MIRTPRDVQFFASSPALSTLGNLQSISNGIYELSSDDYDSEAGESPPGDDNLLRAVNFLSSAFGVSQSSFPPGYASTTGMGDIRVYWRGNERDLQVIIPADVKVLPSLYRRENGESWLDAQIDPADLASAFKWFYGV